MFAAVWGGRGEAVSVTPSRALLPYVTSFKILSDEHDTNESKDHCVQYRTLTVTQRDIQASI